MVGPVGVQREGSGDVLRTRKLYLRYQFIRCLSGFCFGLSTGRSAAVTVGKAEAGQISR